MKRLLYILIFLLFVSCEREVFISNDTLRFKFVVDSSQIQPPPEKNGWTKIYGYTYDYVHYNSFRVVQMNTLDSYPDSIWIGVYSYINGFSPQDSTYLKQKVFKAAIGDTIDCLIKTDYYYAAYYLTVRDRTYTVIQQKDWIYINMGFFQNLNYPYIGGTYTYEEDVHFPIWRKKWYNYTIKKGQHQ